MEHRVLRDTLSGVTTALVTGAFLDDMRQGLTHIAALITLEGRQPC